MCIKDNKTLSEFLSAVENCTGDVYLVSPYGDRYNLKSSFSKYLAIGALLSDNGDNLEIFCDRKEDEGNFMEFFSKNPDIL